MQVTIELPERLAERVKEERGHLAEILERALSQKPSRSFGLAHEIIEFLAQDPAAEQIVDFKASARSQQRARELLEKNRQGTLTADEQAEMDEVEALDNFFAVLRARARRSISNAA